MQPLFNAGAPVIITGNMISNKSRGFISGTFITTLKQREKSNSLFCNEKILMNSH
jgi:hypothetical protein